MKDLNLTEVRKKHLPNESVVNNFYILLQIENLIFFNMGEIVAKQNCQISENYSAKQACILRVLSPWVNEAGAICQREDLDDWQVAERDIQNS
jgi:hypothetical protein